MVLITNYSDDFLESMVRFWNSSFRTRRNFMIITPEILRAYCIDKPGFDPKGFFLSVEHREVVGMGHAGYAEKGHDKERGLIYVLAVRPDSRRMGIGGQLLDSCELYLSEVNTITVGAMGGDAFYNRSKSSLLPLWGSSEGIGIEANDSETRWFLEERGYVQLDTAVSMIVDLRSISKDVTNTANIISVPNRWVMAGGPLQDTKRDFLPPPAPCRSLVYLEDGIIAGKIVTFSMSELELGRAAIVDFWVHGPYRGKGIGSILLDAALSNLLTNGFQKVELLTDPLKNSTAYTMYERHGFRVDARWCSYQKTFRAVVSQKG